MLIPPTQEQEVLNEGFEDGNSNGWSTSGNVSVNGQQAIGQFSLRHRKNSNSVLSLSTTGYNNVSVKMHLAATSLESGDSCFAEFSDNGGSSWTKIVEVNSGSDNGTFHSGTSTAAGLDNNPSLRLRFRSTGNQNSDYCWGDEVTILGAPEGGSAGSFIVSKDFSDDVSNSVSISLSCTSGTVTNSPQNASESLPAVFIIQGYAPGATCTAKENGVPSGYMVDDSDCQDGDLINSNCTIINTRTQSSGIFRVFKDFSDNNSASVGVTLSCSGATVTNNPQLASESSPANFIISGGSPGTTCTAIENSIPPGYTVDQSDCQNGDPLNGSCTIMNSFVAPEPGDIFINGFE